MYTTILSIANREQREEGYPFPGLRPVHHRQFWRILFQDDQAACLRGESTAHSFRREPGPASAVDHATLREGRSEAETGRPGQRGQGSETAEHAHQGVQAVERIDHGRIDRWV